MRWPRKSSPKDRDKVEAMTAALLEWETIDADQIGDIMAGRPARPPKPSADTAATDERWGQTQRTCAHYAACAGSLSIIRNPELEPGGFGPSVFMSVLHAGPHRLSLTRPLIMGIVNTTPDSFSDGGHWRDAEAAIQHALQLQEAGADILDVGGESTRPGAVRCRSTRKSGGCCL